MYILPHIFIIFNIFNGYFSKIKKYTQIRTLTAFSFCRFKIWYKF